MIGAGALLKRHSEILHVAGINQNTWNKATKPLASRDSGAEKGIKSKGHWYCDYNHQRKIESAEALMGR